MYLLCLREFLRNPSKRTGVDKNWMYYLNRISGTKLTVQTENNSGVFRGWHIF